MTGDALVFLARSPNRAAVLAALREAPADRTTLRERVDASRVTVGRITTDLEERGWIERSGQGYRVTAAGRAVSEAYERFVDTVETTRRLADVFEYLPTERFDFDVVRLADAEVLVPTPTDPGHHLSRLAAMFERYDTVRLVAHAVEPRVVTTAAENGTTIHGVVTPEVVDAMRADPALLDRAVPMVEEGTLDLRVAGRDVVDVQFGVFGRETMISADDDLGIPRGIVVSEAPEVREWALSAYESFRERATPLGATRLRSD